MKASRVNLIVVSLACLTVVSLAGSSLGTLAWYAYSTRATMAYTGTAVRKTEQLQIGLLWGDAEKAADTTFETTYKVTKEVIGDHSYYFMPAGVGFSSTAINYYLSKFGHATNELPPVTSRTYTSGDLTLWESPTYTYNNSFSEAAPIRYVELPFVFRVLTNSGTGVEGTNDGSVANANIWLTDALAQTEGEKDVANSLRVHVHNYSEANASKQFILNPTAVSSGNTVVAGLLDLNNDGYYDFKEIDGHYTELVYGDRTVPDPYSYTTFDADDEVSFADINDTGAGNVTYDAEKRTTFYGRHHAAVKGFTTLNDITRNTAHYLSFEDIRPTENDGVFTGDYPMAKTSVEEDSEGNLTAIGRADLTIWLEGWDHSIVDSNIGARFNLGLQFEIDRV